MNAETPDQQVLFLSTSYWISQGLFVLAKLGIPDRLAQAPTGARALALHLGCQPESLHRLLRSLAGMDILHALPGHDHTDPLDRPFSLTPLSDPLRSDHPASLRSFVIMMGEEHFTSAGDLLYSVRTGKTAFEKNFGKPVFEYLAENPEAARTFDSAMVGIHHQETEQMMDAYDLSDLQVLVDIGGGNGSTLRTVLARLPSLRGILFDLPHVVERAKAHPSAESVARRLEFVSGDFFREVAVAADAFLLRHILHDWEDERALALLRNLRRAARPTDRLLVVECVVGSANAGRLASFLDLVMLTIPGGRERTAEEYERLFAQAGFRLKRIVPTRSEMSVIEGVPI